jgi:hypothetical protein
MEVGNISSGQGQSNGVFACLFLYGERSTPRGQDGPHAIDGEGVPSAVSPRTRSMTGLYASAAIIRALDRLASAIPAEREIKNW